MRCYNHGCRPSARRCLVSSGRVQGTQGIGRRGGIRRLEAPTNRGAVWNRTQGRYDLPAAASLQSFAVCPSTPRLKTTWFLCSSKVGGSALQRRSSLYQLCGAALGTTSFTMTREAAITLTLTLAVPLNSHPQPYPNPNPNPDPHQRSSSLLAAWRRPRARRARG